MAEGILQDFNNCWWLILIGLAVSMVVSFLWIVLMRFIAGIMVWLSVIAVVAMQAFGKLHTFIPNSIYKMINNPNKLLPPVVARGGGRGFGHVCTLCNQPTDGKGGKKLTIE